MVKQSCDSDAQRAMQTDTMHSSPVHHVSQITFSDFLTVSETVSGFRLQAVSGINASSI
jgi:hypothetical protein